MNSKKLCFSEKRKLLSHHIIFLHFKTSLLCTPNKASLEPTEDFFTQQISLVWKTTKTHSRKGCYTLFIYIRPVRGAKNSAICHKMLRIKAINFQQCEKISIFARLWRVYLHFNHTEKQIIIKLLLSMEVPLMILKI